MPYEIFCASVQGAGHIKNDLPCEDYGAVYEDDICKVFALGDGHGDSNCPRSKIGSEYICKIALEELSHFAKTIANEHWEERLLIKADAEELVSQLITSIFGKWSCAVDDEYSQNPLTEEEIAGAAEYIERYRKGERIEHVYGTTFIAGLLTDSYLLLLQQGDGRCVVFDDLGNVSQPIPWDNRCFANVTTSVCDVDAVQSCRYYVINQKESPIAACFAGSDGVEDSFPGNMEKMHAYYRELLEYACKNTVSKLKTHLKSILPELSLNGSQDDTTICGIIDCDIVNSLLDKFSEDNKIIELQDEIYRADERLKSMYAKFQHLKSKHDTAIKDCEEAKKKFEDVSLEFQRVEKDIASFEDPAIDNSDSVAEKANSTGLSIDGIKEIAENIKDNIKEKVLSEYSIRCLKARLETLRSEVSTARYELTSAEEKKKKAEDEFFPYRDRYEGYLQMKDTAVSKMEAIKNNAD